MKKTRQEHEILTKLHHQNVVRVHGLQESEDGALLFIIMDLCGGGELFDCIVRSEGGRMGEAEARRFFVELVRGIGHCHAQKVAHRDLKPEVRGRYD